MKLREELPLLLGAQSRAEECLEEPRRVRLVTRDSIFETDTSLLGMDLQKRCEAHPALETQRAAIDCRPGRKIVERLQNGIQRSLRFILAPWVKRLWIGQVTGVENIPREGRVIIASNHESYFDFLCFSAVCPRPVHYLAGEVFFKKWWWRPLVALTNQIRVDRHQDDKSSAITKALDVLRAEETLGIFPEGTRSKDGRLQKAFTGVARLALESRSPVVPVGMMDTYKIMSRHDKFPHLEKCRIRIGKPIDLSRFYGRENDKETLRYITDKIIMARIARLTGRK